MKAYHVTSAGNVTSILSDGLHPRDTTEYNWKFQSFKHKGPAVYVFLDIKEAQAWANYPDAVILELDIPECELDDNPSYPSSRLLRNKIPPLAIRYDK